MTLEVNSSTEHILILGAGASVPYGLPAWKDLGSLIKAKITADKEDSYSHKKGNGGMG